MRFNGSARKRPRALAATLVLAAGVAATALASNTAHAYDENSASEVNVNEQRVILKGYDPVAYFTDDKPTPGSSEFTATHDGATYHFASAANRDAFEADPGKYAPQFGGFCAMGVANGLKLDVDPTLYRVVGGKLYVNVNQQVQTRWLDNPREFISRADSRWPAIVDKAPKNLTPG